MTKKPALYNGFSVREGLTVKSYIERTYFTDVYRLSDQRYLYLLLNLDPINAVNKEKYDLVEIRHDSKSCMGVIVESHSMAHLFSITEDLTRLKGLECVAGMNGLKDILVSDVINPLRDPAKFEKFRVSIPNGIILYGPPGCGKTFIVRKLAEELDYNFVDVKHSDLATPFIHGAVSNIGKAFSKAQENSPTILFFDEISGLVPDRKNMVGFDSGHKEEEVNEFLMQLNDAADKKILVVGATNYIDRIDPAVLRPGRFDKKIHVDLPDFEAREALFRIGLAGRPFDRNIDLGDLARLTEGLSCADIIEDVIKSAARLAANRDLEEISQVLIKDEIVRVRRQNQVTHQ